MSRTRSTFHKLGGRPALGPLESEVMEVVWSRGEVTVREVYDQVRAAKDLAYTTVMTVMHNLQRKGMLARRVRGQVHTFRPLLTREEFIGREVAGMLDRLLENFSEPVLAHLMDRLSRSDPKRLEELERLIRARRSKDRGTPRG